MPSYKKAPRKAKDKKRKSPALAFNLKGALRPAVRDDDVEYEGMCRCLVEMLLNKEGMFCELYDKEDKFLGLNRIRHRLVPGVWGYDCVLGDCVLGDLGRDDVGGGGYAGHILSQRSVTTRRDWRRPSYYSVSTSVSGLAASLRQVGGGDK